MCNTCSCQIACFLITDLPDVDTSCNSFFVNDFSLKGQLVVVVKVSVWFNAIQFDRYEISIIIDFKVNLDYDLECLSVSIIAWLNKI